MTPELRSKLKAIKYRSGRRPLYKSMKERVASDRLARIEADLELIAEALTDLWILREDPCETTDKSIGT